MKSKSKAPTVSSEEKRWRAESDARALQTYAEIQSDSKRRKAAETVLKDEIKKSQMVLSGNGKPANK